jgi:hypothetical protein
MNDAQREAEARQNPEETVDALEKKIADEKQDQPPDEDDADREDESPG